MARVAQTGIFKRPKKLIGLAAGGFGVGKA